MKLQKIKGRDIKLPKKKAFTVKTPDDLPSLHGIFVFSAKRGSGKGVATSNLIQMYKKAGCADRVFFLTPTFQSNAEIWSPLDIDEDDIYEKMDDSSLTSVKNKMDEEFVEWEEYHKKLKDYNKFLRFLNGEDVRLISDDILLDFYVDGELKPPTHKWNGKKPVIWVVIDDAQGSAIMRPGSSLNQFCIRHRHQSKGMGVSIVLNVQNFRAQNGINKQIRSNCTVLCVWKTQSSLEAKAISEECAGEVKPEVFDEVYEEATKESKHHFLCIDFHKKPCHPSPFRKNFDTFIIPDMSSDERKRIDG